MTLKSTVLHSPPQFNRATVEEFGRFGAALPSLQKLWHICNLHSHSCLTNVITVVATLSALPRHAALGGGWHGRAIPETSTVSIVHSSEKDR